MSVEKLVAHFSALEDPRCAGKVDHRLIDILVIAVSGRYIIGTQVYGRLYLKKRSSSSLHKREFLKALDGIRQRATLSLS